MSATTTPRARAVRALTREIGQAAVPAFLRTRQPAFDDQTGAEILEREPEELIRRLELLEHHRELAEIGREESP